MPESKPFFWSCVSKTVPRISLTDSRDPCVSNLRENPVDTSLMKTLVKACVDNKIMLDTLGRRTFYFYIF